MNNIEIFKDIKDSSKIELKKSLKKGKFLEEKYYLMKKIQLIKYIF